MKLELSLPALDDAVRRMGAQTSDWRAEEPKLDPRQQLLIELREGKEIPLDEVEPRFGGLLTHKGEQVILYIKNTRKDRYTLEHDLDKAPKFHIAECAALDNMRRQGRFERYVVTNNLSGDFDVVARDYMTKQTEEMTAKLFVCKKCLETLNWENFSRVDFGQRNKIRDAFSIEYFFKEYSTFFKYKPRYTDKNTPPDGYAPGWRDISRRYRDKMNWSCESCGVSLEKHRKLLDCHHRSGVTSDNSDANLEALCEVCHSAQPSHGHMKPSSHARMTIERLRREQGLT